MLLFIVQEYIRFMLNEGYCIDCVTEQDDALCMSECRLYTIVGCCVEALLR